MQAATVVPIDQLKVLLVDDDATVREAVTNILRRRGWAVSDFAGAVDAIAALKTERFDVVLADINMPGLSGMDLLTMAKDCAPGVPVVMITGYPSIDLAVEAIKVGAADFLPKPFKADELERAVRKAAMNAKGSRPVRTGRAVQPEQARRRLEDKIKELSILHTISETLDDVSDKDVIFRKTMDIAQIITDSERAFVLVPEQGRNELVVRGASGYEDGTVVGSRFSPKEEPFREVITSKCYSYLESAGCLLGPLAPGSAITPVLLAPLTINKEVAVILGITCKPGAAELTSEILTLLLNLTAKAALKLENIALSENIFTSIIGAINSLLNALDARDTYTKDHSHRVTQYAVEIARAMNCPREVVDSLSFAGPLHDIGKIGVRDEILLKKGHFSVEDREIIKTHVVRGEEILRPLNLLDSEKAVVLYHHERWDGKGYPKGLAGSDIPQVARIFSVADTYDAMTSTRPYRNALGAEVSREEIIRCKGSQFDPEVVDAFLESSILKG